MIIGMKERMSLEKKTKLIYSGELIGIALIVLVIGILKMIGTINSDPTRLLVYNIITIIGSSLFLANFIWALVSPKKRARSCMLDHYISIPVVLYLIGFDIYCFIMGKEGIDYIFAKYSVGSVLIYIAIDYIFQGIYHYFHLTPQLEQAIKEELEEEALKQQSVDSGSLDAQVCAEQKEETQEDLKK